MQFNVPQVPKITVNQSTNITVPQMQQTGTKQIATPQLPQLLKGNSYQVPPVGLSQSNQALSGKSPQIVVPAPGKVAVPQIRPPIPPQVPSPQIRVPIPGQVPVSQINAPSQGQSLLPQINVPTPGRSIAPQISVPTPGQTAPQIRLPNSGQPAQNGTTIMKTNMLVPMKGGILKQFEGRSGIAVSTVTSTPQVTAAPVVNIVQETGYSIMMGLMDVWNGTEEQVKVLLQLRYSNGNLIIDPNRKDIIMEIIGMLRIQSFDEIIDFLTDAPSQEYILWDQKSMDEGRNKVSREIDMNQAKDEGVKGIGKCRYCPSTELAFATKQTRSGDEPMTVFVRCVMCQKQWRE